MAAPHLGTFCPVLHSHLPWLAHHGSWPVGEEWLYQAWSHSYLPVVDVLERLADEGYRDVLTLGVTPVLAAQWDDPYCLRAMHDWLGGWLLRAQFAAGRAAATRDSDLAETATREYGAASTALCRFEDRWRHGASPVLRGLVDDGVVELLGGPLTHPFQPLLDPRIRAFALAEGLNDTALRIGHRPAGIWAPECGYAPGMERDYARAGVRWFLADGSALRGETAFARPVAESDVMCFGRDTDVAYRVWSLRSGYPGDSAYRDFHTFDHATGLKPARITGRQIPPEDKRPYDPGRAARAVTRHVADFVDTVRRRLTDLARRHGRPALVVAAFDTELFGHWWYEGPAWLEAVLRALPEAGVAVRTLRGAVHDGLAGPAVELPPSSWGSGHDWRTWDGARVTDLLDDSAGLQRDLLAGLPAPGPARNRIADQAVREALLGLSSDWAFMVSNDSAADYARRRAAEHLARARTLLTGTARAEDVDRWRAQSPFGGLDARLLAA